MKKNGFLTFVFACIPGAGQMYYGYMLRGLSLISAFCISLALASVVYPLAVIAPIVWMYSFFDTYDLIRYLVKGDPKPDGLLLVGDAGDLKKYAINHNKVIGWVLIAFGVWSIYSIVLSPVLSRLLSDILGDGRAWYVLDQLPTVIVAVVLIYFGWRLLGVRTGAPKGAPAEELPPFPSENGGRA